MRLSVPQGFVRLIAITAAILLFTTLCAASPTGGISGLLQDPSGAPVPNVQITVSRTETGARRTTKSGPTRYFEFPQIEPATWSLSAQAAGVKRGETPQVVVAVDQID